MLTHLQMVGVIKRWSGTELLYVEVDGDEIPVFVSDVSKERPATEQNSAVSPDAKEKRKDERQKKTGTGQGLLIAFVPEKSGDEITSFTIYLINDTEATVDFSYFFLLGDQVHFALKKFIPAVDFMLLHTIEFDRLNDIPSLQLEARDMMNQQFTAKEMQKIKPQNFFNKLRRAPVMDTESYCYSIPLRKVKEAVPPQPREEVSFDPAILRQLMIQNVPVKDQEVGTATEEIDLHIEALTKDFTWLSNSEMMQIQLARFQQALERAIAHNAGRIYLIHGLGSGKLKNEIHRLLKQYTEVKSFNNNYHPRYGFGATEVILH